MIRISLRSVLVVGSVALFLCLALSAQRQGPRSLRTIHSTVDTQIICEVVTNNARLTMSIVDKYGIVYAVGAGRGIVGIAAKRGHVKEAIRLMHRIAKNRHWKVVYAKGVK